MYLLLFVFIAPFLFFFCFVFLAFLQPCFAAPVGQKVQADEHPFFFFFFLKSWDELFALKSEF